ncbi:murein biosynthesis integral membrane protein MurJ [Domibacillus sp. PGB-M46]|uniref:murein biosynthesis integral membrane protein MurJ n=1 Tax=Domibacillus sp. PGB-M46 TaxID=2910255 RepID=UPI001F595B47|nr:murein biosynthesis integral membrane protein MurJ [Domibacillus sp. PGB-M46]MCI2253103.1 murein biosynthesis integral membrane protein MurJ [Domibacillus sp. PGB-M46]
MKKTAILIMLITILSKLLGLLRDVILSYFYGASSISDAYLIALTIPGVIFSFVGVAITTGYIPMYSKILKDSGEEKGLEYTNNIINLMLFLSTFIVIFSLVFTDNIVSFFASGFQGETLTIASIFTKFTIIGVYFTGLVYVFSGYLQLKDNYIVPVLIGIPLNLIFIFSIILSSQTNLFILAIGTTIAYLFQFLILLPSIIKTRYKYKFYVNVKDENFKNMIYIVLPVILGTSVNQINILIDRTLASQLVVGGISALNYADKLNLFVQGIVVTSIVSMTFPLMSKMFVNDDREAFKRTISQSIIIVSLLVVPAIFGFMLFSKQIVSFLFGRGEFDSRAILLTSEALFFYSIGMIGFGLHQVLSKAFYAMQDTKTPVVNATIGLVLNIILNLVLSRFLGIGGLALATSISSLVTAILLFLSLRKKIGTFGTKHISLSFLKILVASFLMGIFAKLSFNYLVMDFSQDISLFLAILIGTISYIIIIYFIKIKDVDLFLIAVKNRIKLIFRMS